MKTKSHYPYQTHRGFTLLEVLVALFVLAIGLLGMALLQTTGLRFNTNSYSRSQATYFAYDIIDRMRANRAGFEAGNYDIGNRAAANTAKSTYLACKSGSCACESALCAAPDLAKYDLGKWYENQDSFLPGALSADSDPTPQRATVVRAGNVVTVTMYWHEQDPGKTDYVMKSQAWEVEL